jgi:RNA polymerase sigma factor (sigma-70 family)
LKNESSDYRMTLSDEASLIAGMLINEDECILKFVQMHEDRVYAQSYRLLQNSQDAEEVCQDVFLKALRRLPDFEGKSKLSTWLYSIAYTTCLDVLKKRKRRGYEVDLDEHPIPDWDNLEGALGQLEAKEQRDMIDSALGDMEETEALLLDLYYLQSMPTREIMDITGLSDGNIRIKLMRARKKLALTLSQELPRETLEQYGHGRA